MRAIIGQDDQDVWLIGRLGEGGGQAKESAKSEFRVIHGFFRGGLENGV
jgi:hypothetical protein